MITVLRWSHTSVGVIPRTTPVTKDEKYTDGDVDNDVDDNDPDTVVTSASLYINIDSIQAG